MSWYTKQWPAMMSTYMDDMEPIVSVQMSVFVRVCVCVSLPLSGIYN